MARSHTASNACAHNFTTAVLASSSSMISPFRKEVETPPCVVEQPVVIQRQAQIPALASGAATGPAHRPAMLTAAVTSYSNRMNGASVQRRHAHDGNRTPAL